MESDYRAPPGLDRFWEQADWEGSSEHPLERELNFHLDCLARYRSLLADAQAAGREQLVEIVSCHCDREERTVHDLRDALRRMRADD